VPDGAILALAGSPDYGGPDAGQVNAAAARRSSGSTLKPFLYALAFDRGLCAPSTVFRDEPAVYAGYEPRNFDESFRGPVTARAALAGSLNIPAIRLLEALGPARALETLRAAGLRTLDRPASHYGLGLAVGGGEVRLTDLVNAYAALARGGDARPPRRLLDEPPAPGRAVVSPEAAFLALDILADDERAAAWAGHGGDGAMPRAAWKTGTSPGQRDAWAVACNPDYAVGVWIGNPDGTPSESLVGTTAAVPPVAAAFRWLYRDRAAPAFAPPPGVIRARGPDGAGAAGARAWDWAIAAVSPPPGRPFATAAGGARLDGAAAAPPRIVSPADGERFRRLPDAAGAVQELRLSAAGAGGPLYWFANGQPVGASAAGDDVYWPLRRGDWTLACSDAAGRSARVRISVE
jgi:penicillin-binding protein 1C